MFLLESYIERRQLLPVRVELVVVELGELLCAEGSALFWRGGMRIMARCVGEKFELPQKNAMQGIRDSKRGLYVLATSRKSRNELARIQGGALEAVQIRGGSSTAQELEKRYTY